MLYRVCVSFEKGCDSGGVPFTPNRDKQTKATLSTELQALVCLCSHTSKPTPRRSPPRRTSPDDASMSRKAPWRRPRGLLLRLGLLRTERPSVVEALPVRERLVQLGEVVNVIGTCKAHPKSLPPPEDPPQPVDQRGQTGEVSR